MLDLRNVMRRFGTCLALDDVSLHVDPGETVVIRGPSGSGKTTLLRLVAGLTEPDAGEIWLHGRLAGGKGVALPPHLRGIAMVFQEPRLWPHMSVRENLRFAISRLDGRDRTKRLEMTAARTGIEELLDHYPAEISSGQARRVALARALAPNRPLVLMDEPLANIDDEGRADLTGVIRRFWEEEKFALLYVTHDAAGEASFAPRCIRMEKGRIISCR